MEKKPLVPPEVYCPKCGGQVHLDEITDAQQLHALGEKGYVAGANGRCQCGVLLALVVQPMPKSPTFTLMFDLYVQAESIKAQAPT